MKREDFEKLGDRMKRYEVVNQTYLVPGLPLIVRLDGRAFHTFTKGLEKPYDKRMSEAMQETTKYLVHEFNAKVAGTQSDEISLVFYTREDQLFNGRVEKIVSVLASVASVKFNSIISKTIPDKAHMLPVFDARAYNVPNLDIAAEQLIWREADATRNSLTMAAHHYFTTKELHKVGFKGKHDLLHSVGVNWNDYPNFFKKGSYFSRVTRSRLLTEEELSHIPEQYRPTGLVDRTEVEEIELPPLKEVEVAKNLLFGE